MNIMDIQTTELRIESKFLAYHRERITQKWISKPPLFRIHLIVIQVIVSLSSIEEVPVFHVASRLAKNMVAELPIHAAANFIKLFM